MAHLTNFSFEFFNAAFTWDTDVLYFFYTLMQKVKNDQNSNEGGPAFSLFSARMCKKTTFWRYILRDPDWIFILFPCSQLTSLRQKILETRFARFIFGLISYKTNDLQQ